MPTSLSQVGIAPAKPRSLWVSRAAAGHGLVSPRRVVFAEPPPRLKALGNITASPGQDVVMSCPVLSSVPYNLTWSWDGKVAQPGDGRARLLQNHSLEISRVQPEDGGLYECVARSAHGTATASLWLFIQGRLCPARDPGLGDALPRGWMADGTRELSFSPTLCHAEAPWVKVDASPQRFSRGQELGLNCVAGGYPPPHTTWRRWGWALEQDER